MTSKAPDRPGHPTARGGLLAILLFGVLALLLAVLWMRRSVPDVDLAGTAAPMGLSPDDTSPNVRDAAGERARSPVPTAREDDGQDAGLAVETPTIPRESIDVLVLDAITWAPIAGAEVRWANAAELGMPRNPAEYGVHYDPGTIDRRVEPVLTLEISHRTTTDERGIARVDSRVFPGRVSALHGESSGSEDVGDRRISPIRVYIREQRAIPIEVVDGAGVPVVGVPVSLRAAPVIDRSSVLWLGNTGESGLVRAELAKPRKPDSAGWTVHACLEIPLLAPVTAQVDLRKPITEPIRLVLPPCGSVVVNVREEDGRAAAKFGVALCGEPSLAGTYPRCRDRGPHDFEPDRVSGSEARFTFVGLGLDVCASAWRTNDFVQHARFGPRTAGDVVHFDLPLAGREPEVIGRFLTEAGGPLRERLVQIVFDAKQGSRFRYPLLTDADGRFRFFASVPERPGLTGTLLAMPIGIGAGEGGAVQTAVDVERTDDAHDLGDLVVVSPRVVGAGLVVDDVGAPVPWPQIGVFAPSAWSDNGWYPNDRLRVAPHGDGRFDILASTDFARIRVRAWGQGRAESEYVEFDPGARDVLLVTPRGCEIAGRVLVDPGVYEGGIHVHAIGPGPRIEAKTYRQATVAYGAFQIAPIAPGRYDLEFRRGMGSKEELIHRLEGIDVPPAGKAVDARLDAIDLRGKIALPKRR